MKNIFLICMLMLGLTSFAQPSGEIVEKSIDSTLQTNASEAERLIDKYSDKAVAVVESLADSLAVPAEHVYKVLVKQALVDSVTYLLTLLFSLVFWKIGHHTFNKCEEEEVFIPITIAVWVIAIICTLVGLINMDAIVQGFVNPEYTAMQTILEIFKK